MCWCVVKQVNMHEAKTHPSRLMDEVAVSSVVGDRLSLAQAQDDGLLLMTFDQQLVQHPGLVRRMG